MKIGVISDTHGHLPNARDAAEVLRAEEVDLVIHCGDIGSVDVPPIFAEWKTYFVFGNVDRNKDELRHAIESAGLTCCGRFGELVCEDRAIAFLHSDDSAAFSAACTSGQWDMVCYGHTHIAEHHKVGKTLVLNPGALYRANPHTLAIVTLPQLSVRRVAV